MIENDTFRFCP